jgi:hypothetical protein
LSCAYRHREWGSGTVETADHVWRDEKQPRNFRLQEFTQSNDFSVRGCHAEWQYFFRIGNVDHQLRRRLDPRRDFERGGGLLTIKSGRVRAGGVVSARICAAYSRSRCSRASRLLCSTRMMGRTMIVALMLLFSACGIFLPVQVAFVF